MRAIRTVEILVVRDGSRFMQADIHNSDGGVNIERIPFDDAISETSNHFNAMKRLCDKLGWIPATVGGWYDKKMFWVVED